jgi:hypothetical protein
MRCPLSSAAALACAWIAVSDTDDERSRFIVPGVCGRLSNAAAWACASANFGDTGVCESASAAVVAKIAGIRNKLSFMGVLVVGERDSCVIARTLRSGWLRRRSCNACATRIAPVDVRRVALFLIAAHNSPWHARSCQQAAAIVRGISRAA